LLHGLNSQPGSFNHSRQVDINDLLPDAFLVIPEGRVFVNACIVDDNVNSAKVFFGGGEKSCLLLVFCYIALDKDCGLFLLAIFEYF
jgi:hypothetical protein